MSKKREERIFAIRSYLGTHKYASVNELSELFKVSRSTIKRDTAYMADQDMIERVHGGLYVDSVPAESARAQAHSKSNPQKTLIAGEAAKLIDDDDVILIMAGATCCELYKAIQAENVTVFSLNANILTIQNPGVSHLYVLEGEVRPRQGAVEGGLAIDNLSRITPTKIFFATSLDANFNLGCRTDQQLALLKAAAAMDAEKIYMADSSKLRDHKTFNAFPLETVQTFITDIVMDEETKNHYESLGVRIIQVPAE